MDGFRRQTWTIKHHEQSIMSIDDEDETYQDNGKTEPSAAEACEGDIFFGGALQAPLTRL